MGIIFAKFRREKSTQEVLETLQEQIDTLETFTVNTQEQKKRFVGNFLAVSIGLYVTAIVIFYFVYYPPTWPERILYFFLPLLLFPVIIILLRSLFAWYFQRKINKNSKKLTALRAEKKKILEQVMDKETYKVAVNLLARFADKPSKSMFALSPTLATTPTLSSSRSNQPLVYQSSLGQSSLNRSLPTTNISQRRNQMAISSTPPPRSSGTALTTTTPRLTMESDSYQQLRRRTPFPIVNQQEKGVFDRIVDVLIGDGPQDRFAMICKECYSHNGMALKEDFEYATFRCAFCNTLNPARKARPVAPRLSILPAQTTTASDSSESEDNKNDSENEIVNGFEDNTTEFSTPKSKVAVNNEVDLNNDADVLSPSSEDKKQEHVSENLPQSGKLDEKIKEPSDTQCNKSLDELLKQLEKSDSAIEDTTMSPQ